MSDEQTGGDRPQPTEAIPTSQTEALGGDALASDPTAPPAPAETTAAPDLGSSYESPFDAPATSKDEPAASTAYSAPATSKDEPAARAAYSAPPPSQQYQPPAQGYPYGQQAPAPSYAPAPYGSTTTTPTNTSALTLTILSGISLLFCGGLLLIPAGIFGILGLTKQTSDPTEAAKMTRWGWIAFGVGWVASILLTVILLFVVFGLASTSRSGY